MHTVSASGGVDALGRGDWMDPPSRTGWMD